MECLIKRWKKKGDVTRNIFECKFQKSACYDDLIKVKTQLVKMPTASIEFNYEIINQNGEVLTFGNTVLAFIDMKTNRPMRCPKYLLDKLQD